MTIPDPSRRRFLRLTALGGGATFVAVRRGSSPAARARRAAQDDVLVWSLARTHSV